MHFSACEWAMITSFATTIAKQRNYLFWMSKYRNRRWWTNDWRLNLFTKYQSTRNNYLFSPENHVQRETKPLRIKILDITIEHTSCIRVTLMKKIFELKNKFQRTENIASMSITALRRQFYVFLRPSVPKLFQIFLKE